MLSKLSVKKPYTIVVAVVLVIILGFVSFSNMTVDLLPSMNLPYALVITTYPGASPEEVEATVTKPIEQTMATVSNIKNVSSSSSENASTVILEFDQTANMDSVTIEMRESLDQISGYWPDAVGNPLIMKLNPDMMPVMVAAVSVKDENSTAATRIIEEEVIPEIESIEGVASVTEAGTVEETVEITVNPDKIQSLNDDVKASLDGKFAEAGQALAEARAQVESGKAALEAGQREAAAQMGKAEAEVSKKNAELTQGQLEVNEKVSELNLAQAQLEAKKTEISTQEAALTAQKQALEALKENEEVIRASYDALLKKIEMTGTETAEDTVAKNALAEQIAQLDNYDAVMEQAEAGMGAIEAGKAQLAEAEKQMEEGKAALDTLKEQLNQGAISQIGRAHV